jgi:hypothetical protein
MSQIERNIKVVVTGSSDRQREHAERAARGARRRDRELVQQIARLVVGRERHRAP